jgi:hypothetical protein
MQFVESARSFCHLIESHHAFGASPFAEKMLGILPRLYLAALQLSDLEIATEDPLVSARQHLEIRHVHVDLAHKLEPYNFYWDTLNLFAYLDEAAYAAGDLADDLIDIYGDLKVGLNSFDKGTETNVRGAPWHWQFSFSTHWGKHLVDAVRVLHYLVFAVPHHKINE